jgi:hypothetical protein
MASPKFYTCNTHMICRNSVLSFSKPFGLNLYSSHVSGKRPGTDIRFVSTRYLDTVNEPKLPRFIRRQHLQEGSSKKHAQQVTSNTETFTSRRYLPSQDTVNEPKLPRFIRRQQLQEDSVKKHAQQITSKTRAQSPSLSPMAPPTHRSRHYDPSNEEPKANMRLLEPHVLSKRLKTLCDSHKIDDAVSMLKNAPLDAQNTQVWNTLIWEALKAKRFKLSYQLFIDVRNTLICFLLIGKLIYWPEIDETART